MNHIKRLDPTNLNRAKEQTQPFPEEKQMTEKVEKNTNTEENKT